MATIKDWTQVYPAGIDSTTEMPTLVNGSDYARASQINSLRDSIIQIETVVGSDAYEAGSIRAVMIYVQENGGISVVQIGSQYIGWSSAAPTLGTWNQGDIIWDSTTANLGWVCTVAGTPGTWTAMSGGATGPASGDLSGTYPNPTVSAIEGYDVVPTQPVDGYALTWNNGLSQWEAGKPVPGGTAGGDLSGLYPNPIVSKIEGYDVVPTQPVDGYALTWNNGLSQWESSKPIPGGAAGGDLSGLYPNPTVSKIEGYDVVSTQPVDGYALTWNNGLSQWEAGKPVPGGTAGGDLSGTYPNPTVDAIEGYAISPTQPVDGYALTWNNGLSKWEAGKPVPGGTAGGDLSGTYPKPTVDAIQGKAISTAIASVQGSSLSWDSGNQIFKDTSRAWAIGETQTDGIVLENTTPAIVTLNQHSPSLILSCRGWYTTSGASQKAKFRIYAHGTKEELPRPGGLGYLKFSGWNDVTSTWTELLSFSNANTSGYICSFANTGIVTIPNFWCGSLRIQSSGTFVVGFDAPLDIQHIARTDGANNIVIKSNYDVNTASITNAATMRVHSFGWTNNSDVFTELAAVYCDGYVWGNQFSALGSTHNGLISMGVVPIGIANDYGIYTTSSSNTLSIWSTKSSGSGNVSTAIVADVNNATIDPDHKVLQIGWVNNSNVFTELFSFKDSEISMNSSASAKILSSEADGGSVVAVTIGSDEKYETSGAKLLSVQNGTVDGYERANVDYSGDLCINKQDNIQSLNIKSLTELCVIEDAADGYSTIQLPAESLIIGINVRVVTTITGTSTFSLGVSGDYDYFATGVSSVSGTTKICMTNGIFYNTSARSILITPNTTPSDANGRVRVTINYISMTAPNG